jgi:hypothetical protein
VALGFPKRRAHEPEPVAAPASVQEENRELIGALENKFTKAANARKPLDTDWVLDAAFFSGHQYTEYNVDTGRFQTIPRSERRPKQVRCVDNRVYSLVMDTWAMAKGHDPAVEVVPTNVDSTEIAKSRVAQAYADHIAFPTQADWKAERDAALFWTCLCGPGWLKVTYNKALGRPDIEACSPLEVYLQPGVKNYRRANWIIHTMSMDPEDVYNAYGVELPASDVDSQDALKTQILRELGMVTGNPTVTVKELWELPSRRHPKGRFITWTRNRIIQNLDFPYDHKMLPFAQIGHSPVPGTAHYSSGTKIARPLNMELNSYHNQKLDHRKRYSDAKWFVDSTMDLNEDPDDSGGQVLKGDTRGGLLPPPVQIPGVPWVESGDGEWIEGAMDNAVGVHAASRGEAPGRVDSAQGIESLQEGDHGRLSEVEGTLITATARVFGMVLSLAQQYVTEEVMVPLYSANGAQFVHAFKTSQFPKCPIVKVTMGGGLPKNKAARRQEIIAMWSAGLLGQDPAKALAMLDFPAEANITGHELEEMVARNENMLMLQGIAVTPKPWQNHELHERIHNECRNTAEYDAAGNDVWSTFEFHDEATKAAKLAEMVDAAEEQFAIEEAIAAVQPPEPAPLPEADPNAPDPALQQPGEVQAVDPAAPPAPGNMGASPAPVAQPGA